MRLSLKKKDWFLCVLVAGLSSCNPALRTYTYQPDAALLRETSAEKSLPGVAAIAAARREESSAYIPDTARLSQFPQRILRVNFHFMDHPDGGYNFQEAEAYRFIEGLLHSANNDLEHNNASWLPFRNQLPVLPVRYRMELAAQPDIPGDRGIYFHQDAECAFYIHKGAGNNLYNRQALDRYGVGRDSILNIFIFPHHPDSLLSPTYPPGPVGVMVYNSIKMAGIFESRMQPWAYRGVLNHEVGHVFGLHHAWMADGCDDTPEHMQPCWNRTETPPCDTAASNNVMDYNALQNAWTPCQIGRIHQNMSNEYNPARKLLAPVWCTLKEDQSVVITDSVHWRGSRDLEGHLVIAPGAQLTISCRVSMPAGAKITVQPGGTLILDQARLHNACGDTWQGIELQEKGQRKGVVRILGAPSFENLSYEIP